MPDDRHAVAVHGPVAAGLALGERTVRVGPGQHVVLVWRVAAAVDDPALFGEGGLLGDLVGVAMQLGDTSRDQLALGIVPGPAADPVFGVDAGGAEIGVPGL